MHRFNLLVAGAVPIDEPVIIGAPPAVNSKHTWGRRKFMGENMDEDRQGLPRVIANLPPPKKKKAVSDLTTTKNRQGKSKKKDDDTSSGEVFEVPSESDDDMFDVDNTSPRHTRSVTQKTVSSKRYGKGGNGKKNASKQKKGKSFAFQYARALNLFPAASQSEEDSKQKKGKQCCASISNTRMLNRFPAASQSDDDRPLDMMAGGT